MKYIIYMENLNTTSRTGTTETEKRKFLTNTYGWMALALLISGVTALFTAQNTAMLKMLFSGRAIGYWILAIGEIALVWWLSASIRKISTTVASIAFIAYSVINGITLSSIFFVYTSGSIALCFGVCAVMFALMSLYGMITKTNLASAGKYMGMAVIGIIIASLINLLLKSGTIDWILSLVTVVLFTGLTAYDSQKMLAAANQADGSDMFKKASIIGALELYLDFINIFLSLLRLFGRRD